jgi:bifunctional DNase/RNase
MKPIVFLLLIGAIVLPATWLPAQRHPDAVEVTVVDLEPTRYGVSVTLKASLSDESLHMMIGVNEGEAIARALSHTNPPRPMTHDLITAILARIGWRVQKVVIRGIINDTFLADLVIEKNGETATIDSRPSDALAIAVRTDAKIFVNPDVFELERQREQQDLGNQPGEQPEEPPAPSGQEGVHL